METVARGERSARDMTTFSSHTNVPYHKNDGHLSVNHAATNVALLKY